MAFTIDIGNLLAHLGLDDKQFRKTILNAEQRMRLAGQNMERIGRSMTMRLTAPLAAMGAAIAKTSINIESAWIGVQKTVNATAEEFATLQKQLNELALRIPLSIEQIYGIAESAGQLGIAKQNIVAFTETMSQLAATTNLTADQAAVEMARFANIMGTPQDQFDRMGSSLVELGNNLATFEDEIMMMATRLAGAGKTAGMTESQVFGIAAALSSVGVSAQIGGTSIQKMIIEMSKAVATGSKELRGFASMANMASDDFARLYKSAPVEAFKRIIEGVATAGEDAFAALEELGLGDQRLLSAILRLAKAEGLLEKSLDLSNKAFEENIALVEEALKRFASTESQLKTFWNEVRLTGDAFRDSVIPPLESLIQDYLKPFLEYLRDMDAPTKKLVTDMAILTATIGPLLYVIGKTTTAALALKAAFLGTATGVGIMAMTVSAAFAAIAGYKIGDYLYQEFRSVALGATAMAELVAKATLNMQYTWKLLVAELKLAWQGFVDWFYKFSPAGLLLKVTGQLERVAGERISTDILDKYKAEYREGLDTLTRATDEAIIEIDTKFGAASRAGKLLLGEAFGAESMKEAIKNAQDLIDEFKANGKALSDNKQIIQDILDNLQAEIDSTALLNQGYDHAVQLAQFRKAAEAEAKKIYTDITNELQKQALIQAYINEQEDKFLRKVKELEQIQRGGSLKRWGQEATAIWDRFAEVAVQGLDNLAEAITDFITGTEVNWKQFTASLLKEFLNVMVKMQLASVMQAAFGSAFGGEGAGFIGGLFQPKIKAMGYGGNPLPTAMGGVFHRGQVIPLASGGIIGAASLMPLMGHRTALIGERGPEAVMPITRTPSGELAVKTTEAPRVENKLKIVNVMTQEQQIAAMQSDAGEKVIMNILKRNGVV